MKSKKAYTIYRCEDLPYETPHPLFTVTSLELAKSTIEELNKKEDELRKERKELDAYYNKFMDYAYENDINIEDEDELYEVLEIKFNVSKEFIDRVLDTFIPYNYFYLETEIRE